MLITLLLYLLLGAVAGTIAGLFGVGGGVIMVPALLYAFAGQGLPQEVLTHMAVGTSLAIICISSVSSTLAHHRNGFVVWPVVKAMAPGLVIGVVMGVFIIVYIPGETLQWIIGIYLVLVSIQMGLDIHWRNEAQLPGSVPLFCSGGLIGFLSALFGIGGGSMTVPLLNYWGLRMQQAVACGAACGMPIAFAGAFSNMLAGQSAQGLPQWSLGFVYMPAFLGVAIMSIPFAQLGALLAKRLPSSFLKRLFAVFLVIIGSSLIIRSIGNA